MATKQQERRIKKLGSACRASYGMMEDYRKLRIELLEMIRGHRVKGGCRKATPIPYMQMAYEIDLRYLSLMPRCRITTRFSALRPYAYKLQEALNYLGTRIVIAREFEMAVADAMLFGTGMVKIGIGYEGRIDLEEGEYVPATQPFCKHVDADHMILDMQASAPEEWVYRGDRCRMSFEEMREASFDEDVVDMMEHDQDPRDQERAENMDDDGGPFDSEGLFDEGEVFSIFVRPWQKNIYFTNDWRHLKTEDADCPDTGPYETLQFISLPGSVIGMPPLAAGMDMMELQNDLFYKLSKQGGRQKTLLIGPKGSPADKEELKNAKDGDVLAIDNAGNFRDYSFGGISGESMAFFLQSRDLGSVVFHNLDQRGGLGPQADTYGQEQIIAQATGRGTAAKRQRSLEFMRASYRKLGKYVWEDPDIDTPIVRRIPGTQRDITVFIDADEKRGEFLDYNIDIDVYSAQEGGPEQEKRSTIELYQAILQGAPLMANSGVQPNVKGFVEVMAEIDGNPNLNRLLTTAGPPDPNEQPIGRPPDGVRTKPAETKRTYERVNRPGTTRRGMLNAMTQEMMGRKLQRSEREGGRRSVS